MTIRFGSDIQFAEEERGTGKNKKYRWVAHANSSFPEIIFINKYDEFWLNAVGENKVMIRTLRRLLSHEPIHCILWDFGIWGNYDYLVRKFRKQIKKECPKTFRDYMMF